MGSGGGGAKNTHTQQHTNPKLYTPIQPNQTHTHTHTQSINTTNQKQRKTRSVFGGDRIKGLMVAFQIEDLPMESQMLTDALDTAQKRVESYFYDIRKNLFDYDQVVNTQRDKVYAERRRALLAADLGPLMVRRLALRRRGWATGIEEQERQRQNNTPSRRQRHSQSTQTIHHPSHPPPPTPPPP